MLEEIVGESLQSSVVQTEAQQVWAKNQDLSSLRFVYLAFQLHEVILARQGSLVWRRSVDAEENNRTVQASALEFSSPLSKPNCSAHITDKPPACAVV